MRRLPPPSRGGVPDTLSELPQPEDGKEDRLTDGWGRPIQYTKEGRTVTLSSLGKDGRPGGSGDDADIRAVFTVPEAPARH